MSAPGKKLFWAGLSGAGAAAVFAAAAALYFSKASSVELKAGAAVQKTAGYHAARREIENYLSKYTGQAMGRIDLKKITEDVARIYPAAEVQAARRFPRRLTVFLSQSRPLFLMLKGAGDLLSVFPDGSVRAQRGWDQPLDFPLLRGKSFWESAGLRKQAADFVSALPKKGSLRADSISEILYNRKNKSFVFFLMPGDVVLEAKAPASAQKIKNINFVLEYMERKSADKARPRAESGGWRVNAVSEKKIIVSAIE